MIRKGLLSHAIGALTVALVGSATGCATQLSKELSPDFASQAKATEWEVPAEGQRSPSAELVSSEGIDDVAGARREISAAARGLRECPNNLSVPVRIRIDKNDEGRVHIGFVPYVPTTTFSPEGRRCILDAMSSIRVDDIPSDGSPSNRASSFTATVLLSW